jgi:hypothetical protein
LVSVRDLGCLAIANVQPSITVPNRQMIERSTACTGEVSMAGRLLSASRESKIFSRQDMQGARDQFPRKTKIQQVVGFHGQSEKYFGFIAAAFRLRQLLSVKHRSTSSAPCSIAKSSFNIKISGAIFPINFYSQNLFCQIFFRLVLLFAHNFFCAAI